MLCVRLQLTTAQSTVGALWVLADSLVHFHRNGILHQDVSHDDIVTIPDAKVVGDS